MRVLPGLIALALAMGCGGSIEDEQGTSDFDAAVIDAAVIDADVTDTVATSGDEDTYPYPLPDGSTTIPPLPDADLDTGLVVDGGTCVLPDAASGTWTCCNGEACAGQCVEVTPGHNECRCYGILGGCTSGYVCCPTGPGCTTELGCHVGH